MNILFFFRKSLLSVTTITTRITKSARAEAEGLRLLLCSQTKLETEAMMKSRNKHTMLAEEAVTLCSLCIQSQSHYHSQNKQAPRLSESLCKRFVLRLARPSGERAPSTPSTQNCIQEGPMQQRAKPIINRMEEKTDTAQNYFKLGLKHFCRVNLSFFPFVLDVVSKC